MIRIGLMAATAAAALAVAGCGGGSDNKTLSYSDFSKQANDICKTTTAKTEALGKQATGKAQTDAPLYDQVIPLIQSARDDFAKLKPPEELKADFDKFLSITDQQIAQAKKAQTAAKAGDQQAYIAAVKGGQPLQQQSNIEGSKLGAADCAK